MSVHDTSLIHTHLHSGPNTAPRVTPTRSSFGEWANCTSFAASGALDSTTSRQCKDITMRMCTKDKNDIGHTPVTKA
uniref:Uncharacterized protein n=1 Tax=Babesia bovis TaxID=5865 RepID=S6BI44_BABBO|nr:hypothetical protein [Babesia bovis]